MDHVGEISPELRRARTSQLCQRKVGFKFRGPERDQRRIALKGLPNRRVASAVLQALPKSKAAPEPVSPRFPVALAEATPTRWVGLRVSASSAPGNSVDRALPQGSGGRLA